MQGELALSVKRRHLRFLHPTFLADELNPKPLAGSLAWAALTLSTRMCQWVSVTDDRCPGQRPHQKGCREV